MKCQRMTQHEMGLRVAKSKLPAVKTASQWQKFVAENELNGLTLVEAYDAAFPDFVDKSPRAKRDEIQAFKRSAKYYTIKMATEHQMETTLRSKAQVVAEKMIDAYSDLIDEGTELIRNSETHAEKVEAMANQRENLKMSNPTAVIQTVADPYRNQEQQIKTTNKARTVIQ